HLEAELVRLVPAEHLDRDREPHVVTDDARALDTERAHELAGATALLEERVRCIERLVREPEAELIEDRHAELARQAGQDGGEIVARGRESVHEDEVGAGALLDDEQTVSFGEAHEAATARPALLQRDDVSGYGVRH